MGVSLWMCFVKNKRKKIYAKAQQATKHFKKNTNNIDILSCCAFALEECDGNHSEPCIINGTPDHMLPKEYNYLLSSADLSHFTL